MKVKVKKIWIRFENKTTFMEQEEELKEILCGMSGDCDVVVYLNDEQLKKILFEKADVQQLELLENAFGQENVRVEEAEEEEKPRKQVRHIVPGIVQIIPCNHNMYAVFKEDGEDYKYKVLIMLCVMMGGYILWFLMKNLEFLPWRIRFFMQNGLRWKAEKYFHKR